MWPFDKLFRRKRKALQPESQWVLTLEDGLIKGIDHTGAQMAVRLNDIRTIAIETNDSGPWGADLYWLLFGADRSLAVAFPQGATGENDIIDALMELPGFDEKEMSRAMESTSNATFLLLAQN